LISNETHKTGTVRSVTFELLSITEKAMNNKMTTDVPFTGFNEEAFAFLKKLAKNNNRDWFLPRKPIFEERLQKPMAQLMHAIECEMAKDRVPLATHPKSALFRIYRDIRFSADKSPYHTHVSGALYRDGKKNAPGALYVHIGEKEKYAAAGFWQPERPLLTSWRLRMQAEPSRFLDAMKQLKRRKLEISSSHCLQRMPRGFEAMESSLLAEFFRLQSFIVMRPITPTEALSQSLPRQIARFAIDAKPLLEFGWSVAETKPALFLD
jgi:uncharacterized protein (TIGR02453 family)